VQRALLRVLEQRAAGAMDRRILGALGRWCARKLRDAGALVGRPAGGFYLFPDFEPFRERLAARGVTDSRSLCARLLDECGVAILPGADFGRAPSELTARIAYVDFDGARSIAALEVLGSEATVDEAFLRTHCPNVIEAHEALADWLVSS
jgi:aspartate aminotransferase